MSCSSGGMGVVGISLTLSCMHTHRMAQVCARYGWDADTLGHWLESLFPNLPGSVGNAKGAEHV